MYPYPRESTEDRIKRSSEYKSAKEEFEWSKRKAAQAEARMKELLKGDRGCY